MNRARPLVASSLVVLCASAALADEYTVTGFAGGYVTVPPLFKESMTPAEQATASTLLIAAKVDGLTVPVTLPFQFPYYGTIYGTIVVADDGWLAFGTAQTVQSENAVLPSKSAPNAVVAALWEDLRIKKSGSVVSFTTGTAPNRTFIVAWQHADTVAASTTADLSFEVLLHEGTGVVEIAYSPTGTGTGLSFTAGIENETGTLAAGGPNLENTNSAKPSQGQRFTPAASVVTGTITRDRPVATSPTSGLDGTETGLVVAGARVEIVREDAATRTVVGSALTGADGKFTATVLGLDGAPTLAIDLLAAGDESRVTDTNGRTWLHRIATGVVPAAHVDVPLVHLDATTIANDPDFMKALNVQQAARRGHDWVLAGAALHAPATTVFPQLEIRWVPGSAVASAYTAAVASVPARATISDAPLNPDPYDDAIVLREYGQHVLATIAAFPSGSAPHTWNASVGNETLAFVDGFSFWFAVAALGRADGLFVDTKSSTTAAEPDDLESQLPAVVVTPPNVPPSPVLVPGAIAASLWDLVDDALEPRDAYNGVLPGDGYEILAALDQRKGAAALPSGASAWTISTFFGAWRAASPTAAADHEAASAIFIRHGTFPDDASEPNDTTATATVIPSSSTTLKDPVLSPYNTDYYSFVLGATPLGVSVSYTEATEVTVSIVDPGAEGDVVLASASSGTVVSPVVVVTPAPTPAGTHYVRVTWKSGPAAKYILGIAPQAVLVTGSLPAWTAGQLFNQTLQIVGGLPPVSLSVKPSLPEGMTLVNPEGRLTGTPTVPGVYPLEIVATDASGSGPQSIGTLTLTVNPELTLADVFGLAANVPVDADLGTGGTTASWTPDPLPPEETGLVFTGGATLHLEGATAGAPRAFEVTASATDSVHASLGTTTSHVVVCDPVGGARGTHAAAGKRFGFWFEAIEGSRASFEFSFTGGAAAPQLAAIVDDAGVKLDFGGVVARQGGRTRITNLVVPRTSRYFLVFKADADTTVTAARPNVRAPSRHAGIANIAATDTEVEARFEAVVGARVKIVLTRGHTPVAATPGTIVLVSPSGDEIALPAPRRDRGGDRLTVSGIVIHATGEYVLTLGGDGHTTGPLVFEIDIVTPKNAAFAAH